MIMKKPLVDEITSCDTIPTCRYVEMKINKSKLGCG